MVVPLLPTLKHLIIDGPFINEVAFIWVTNVFRPYGGKVIIGPNFHYLYITYIFLKVDILLLQHVGQLCPNVYVRPNVLP